MQNKSALNRSFSTREKVLLLILAVIAMVVLYYYAVAKNVSDTLEANETKLEDLQTQITSQEAIQAQRAKILSSLDALGDTSSLPEVVSYDNLRNELNLINSLMQPASQFSVSFGSPTLSGTTVRRAVTVNFTAASYEAVESVVSSLCHGKYYCLVDSFSMAQGSATTVSAAIHATFYETTVGATTTAGLV